MLCPTCNFSALARTVGHIFCKYYVNSTRFPEKKFYSVFFVCVLTMTTFLKAGIRPIAGKRRGSGATQNSLSWLSIGFRRRANNTASSPRLCQKQCLCVVWRIPSPRRCLEWEAVPGLINMLAFLATKGSIYRLFFKQKHNICAQFLSLVHFPSGLTSPSAFVFIHAVKIQKGIFCSTRQ